MPKENTHLWFANQVLENNEDEEIKKIISSNIDYFNLGSVAPDVFWYSKNQEVVEISKWIHGKEGNLTNELIFEMMEATKGTKNNKETAFVFGYITHCVLDIVFHPMVIYLTGDVFSQDKKTKAEAEYKHRYWETYLDKITNNKFYYPKLIKKEKLLDVNFFSMLSEKFDIPRDNLVVALKRQSGVLKKLKSKLIFNVLMAFSKVGVFSRQYLAIFYAAVEKEKTLIPEKIEYLDLLTGEKRETTIDDLFARARMAAKERIKIAHEFIQGSAGREQAIKIIKGESLETGKEGMSASRIKFFKS